MQKNLRVKIMFIGGTYLEAIIPAVDESAFRNWLGSPNYGEIREWGEYTINKSNILYLSFQMGE